MVRASVRATIRKSAEERAARAASILATISSTGTRRRPGSWPHFFGISWSSIWIAVGAAPLELGDRAQDVEGIAEAGVAVRDDRQRDRSRDLLEPDQHLVQGDEADVRDAQRADGDTRAGHVAGRKAGLLDEPRGDDVVGAG